MRAPLSNAGPSAPLAALTRHVKHPHAGLPLTQGDDAASHAQSILSNAPSRIQARSVASLS